MSIEISNVQSYDYTTTATTTSEVAATERSSDAQSLLDSAKELFETQTAYSYDTYESSSNLSSSSDIGIYSATGFQTSSSSYITYDENGEIASVDTDQLKVDSMADYSNMLSQMLGETSSSSSLSDLSSLFNSLFSSNQVSTDAFDFGSSSSSSSEVYDISQDVLDMASLLADGDADKLAELKQAVTDAYNEAGGSSLSSESQDSYNKIITGFDDLAKTLGATSEE